MCVCSKRFGVEYMCVFAKRFGVEYMCVFVDLLSSCKMYMYMCVIANKCINQEKVWG